MKQLTILELIWKLIKVYFKMGNAEVFYNICGQYSSHNFPMEVEGVEIRKTKVEDRVTIW